MTAKDNIKELIRGNLDLLELFYFLKSKGYTERILPLMLEEKDKDLTIYYLMSFADQKIRERKAVEATNIKIVTKLEDFIDDESDFSVKHNSKLWKSGWTKEGVIEEYEDHLESLLKALTTVWRSCRREILEEENDIENL